MKTTENMQKCFPITEKNETFGSELSIPCPSSSVPPWLWRHVAMEFWSSIQSTSYFLLFCDRAADFISIYQYFVMTKLQLNPLYVDRISLSKQWPMF